MGAAARCFLTLEESATMKIKLTILAVAVMMLFSSCFALPEKMPISQSVIEQSENTAQFHFIDVGQGDCTLIQSGDTNILIDSGTGESGGIICEYLENSGIKYLDCFIGTHPHEDHLGGGSAVLSSVEVGKVYMNGGTSNSYFFEKLVDSMIDMQITPKIPEIDTVYEVGPFKLEFLSPSKDYGNANDNSLVVTVAYKDIKAIFMGDAERVVEADLIKNGADIRSDIIKVGHHGSRYASSAEFLNAVYPSLAIIQCGKDNSYGHPHNEALERLWECGAKILRNDDAGTIVIRTDGTNLYDASGEVYEKEASASIEQIYIGNKKSKVFHCEECKNLPGENNRVQFKLREDALNAGYSACGNCKP